MNKQFFIWGTVVLGVAFLVAGLLLVWLGYHQQGHIVEELRNENLTVQDPRILLTYEGARAPEGVEVPMVTIDTGELADAQANVIRTHTMASTGGLTYSEMDREDPNRALYITSLTLQTTLHQAHLGFEITLFVMGVGAAFAGFGAYTLVLGLPLVRKVIALK
ncbi:MAG TPA: hypothetical protein VF982_03610 [Anaerolineales bacterium]